MILHAGHVVYCMDGLGRQGRHVAGMQQVLVLVALDQGGALDHQNELHIVMPVRAHWKSVLCRVKQESFVGGVQQVSRFKQIVHDGHLSAACYRNVMLL